MEKRVLKLGAVGTGGIWGAHASNLAHIGDNQVVAVTEINPERREEIASALGARGYASTAEMLAGEPELDAIISCTPPVARLEVVREAATRGIPVFLEKPPASTLDDAAAIVSLVRDHDFPVVVGFMYRWFPVLDRLKELIGDRQINLIQSVFTCPAATSWKLPGWFYIKERSGGHILDQAVHMMDLLRFVGGDITEVQTYGNNVICPKSEEFTIEDSSSTSYRFASGASGVHIHSWANNEFKVAFTVYGKEFALTVELDNRIHGKIEGEAIDESYAATDEGQSHHLGEMRAFLDSVRSGDFSGARSLYPDAAKSLATVLAMNESIESGQPVKVRLNF